MKLIHNYLLERQLCENGLVRVFRAKDRESQKLFTLSLVNNDYEINPAFLMRMISDRSRSQASHPHVANIVDFGEIKQQQYFVSDYVGNKTLSSFLGEPVPVTFALDVISQLASGLHFLSVHGGAHGNIDPDNIFFDPYGNATLFSLELTPKHNGTQQSQISRYQSPEGILGATLDERADLYGLGVLLFELLTSEHFSDRKYPDDNEVENVNELIPYLPEDNFGFQPIINKLLAKNPRQRFNNGLELVDALNEYDARVSKFADVDFLIEFEDEESGEDFDLSGLEFDAIEGSVQEITSKSKSAAEIQDEAQNEVDTDKPLDSQLESRSRKSKFKVPDLNDEHGSDLSISHQQLMPRTNNSKQAQAIISKFGREFSLDSSFYSGLGKTQKYVILGGSFSAAVLLSLMFLIPQNDISVDILPANGGNIALSQALEEKANLLSGREKVTSDSNESVSLIASMSSYKEAPMITQEDLDAVTITAAQISKKIELLLSRADDYLSELKFTTPQNENAYAMFVEVQAIDPNNKQAQDGIDSIAEGYAYMAKRQIHKKNYHQAYEYILKGLRVQEGNDSLISLQGQVNDWLSTADKPESRGARMSRDVIAFDGALD